MIRLRCSCEEIDQFNSDMLTLVSNIFTKMNAFKLERIDKDNYEKIYLLTLGFYMI